MNQITSTDSLKNKNNSHTNSLATYSENDLQVCIAESLHDIKEYQRNCEKVFSEDYDHLVEEEDYTSENVIIVIAKYKNTIIAGQRIIFPKDSSDLLPIERYGANLLKIDPEIKKCKYAEIGKLFVLKEFRGHACNKMLQLKTLEIGLKHNLRYMVWMLRFPSDSYGTEFDEPYIKVMPKKTIKLHMQYQDLSTINKKVTKTLS